jgi:hypothetical protein
MKTIKITVEVSLKDYMPYDWSASDFIYSAIEKELETGEQILSYESIEELIA